jgi:predicted TIM-barrel fold metal-dependent hydrolase
MTNDTAGRTTSLVPSRFIDTHIHLWDLTGELSYQWLDIDDNTSLGSLSEVRFDVWDAQRFLDDVRHHRPDHVVHVQAADGPTDSGTESAWLHSQREKHGFPSAFIAGAQLRSDELAAALDIQSNFAQLRGVRDMTTMGSIGPDLDGGLVTLERHGLSWEAACTWEEMDEVRDLARSHPNLSIVLGHAGFPAERTDEYFAHWSRALRSAAAEPNIACKVSGLGMSDHRWTAQSWQPWIQTCLEAFGAERCMFGSNWPLDRIYASYDAVLSAVADCVSDLSASEWNAFWYDTAARFYHLNG